MPHDAGLTFRWSRQSDDEHQGQREGGEGAVVGGEVLYEAGRIVPIELKHSAIGSAQRSITRAKRVAELQRRRLGGWVEGGEGP